MAKLVKQFMFYYLTFTVENESFNLDAKTKLVANNQRFLTDLIKIIQTII